MKVVFFGTSDYCLPVLDSLKTNFDLVEVITRENKPVGRKQVLTPSATKVWAQKNNISISTLKNLGGLSHLSWDLGIVADFGEMIPEEFFSLPRLGTFNIHFSKLPDLRGASPVQTALLRGDTTAWITIFKIEKTLDTGPILWQKEYPILPDDTAGTLYARLFEEAAKCLPDCIKNYALSIMQNKNILVAQDHSKATYCQKLTKQDGFVKWTSLLEPRTYDLFRAMTPWPGIWTIKNGKRMKILKCHLENNKLVLDEIQFEGKKPQKYVQR